MFIYVFPIALIVVSNVLYNICLKSTPDNANPFSALLVTYLTAAFLTFIILIFNKADKGFAQMGKDLNWTSIALGVAIVALEFGYLMAYRTGWKISLASLVANIALALILIPVGIIFYKDGFDINKLWGVILCVIGLIFINR